MTLFEAAFHQVLKQAARKVVRIHTTPYFNLVRGVNGSLYVVSNLIKDPNKRIDVIFEPNELDEAIACTNRRNEEEKKSAVNFIRDLRNDAKNSSV